MTDLFRTYLAAYEAFVAGPLTPSTVEPLLDALNASRDAIERALDDAFDDAERVAIAKVVCVAAGLPEPPAPGEGIYDHHGWREG